MAAQLWPKARADRAEVRSVDKPLLVPAWDLVLKFVLVMVLPIFNTSVPMFVALKSEMVSKPATRLSAAVVNTKVSLPAAPVSASLPAPPVRVSLPIPPVSESLPVLPVIVGVVLSPETLIVRPV